MLKKIIYQMNFLNKMIIIKIILKKNKMIIKIYQYLDK